MAKKGKIVGSIICGLVAVGAVVGAIYVFGNNQQEIQQDVPPNPPVEKIQLASVQNLQYDQESALLTWNDVTGADSYNVSVNGEVQRVKNTFYPITLTEHETEFKVQAYDSTETYIASEWSDPLVVTFQQENSLVAEVNKMAQELTGLPLRKVLSIHAEGSNIYTAGVYGNSKKVYTFRTKCDHEIQSLEDALNSDHTNTSVYRVYDSKDYDMVSYFLNRQDRGNGYSDQIQDLVRHNYRLDFVTSQAYEETSTTVAIKGIMKASKFGDTRYFSVDVTMYVGDISNEEVKYTSAVEAADANEMYEKRFVEMTGDFADYAQELDEQLHSNQETQDYGMSM